MREMRESGIEWIGTIPTTWELKRIQHTIEEIKVKNSPIQTEQVLSLVKDKGVMLYEDKGDVGNKAKENVSEYKLAYPNTLIVNSMNILIGSVGISDYFGCVSPVYYVFRETPEADLRFINYVFNTREFQKELRKYANGILEIRLRVSASDIFKRKIPLPGKNTQKAIADFLDAKCAEIDALTVDIQTQIDTLEQYKHSVITEAVTKGLNPDVEMKDSGSRWCPLIPIHWELVPAKYLFHNSDLRKQNGDEQLTASQKYGIITQRAYMKLENTSIVLANKGVENWKHVEPNDFIISLRSFQGGLEMSETTGCITWHYVVLKASRYVCYRYYKWLFKSEQYINALQGTCNFIRDGQDLRFSNFSQVPLLVPPIEEQETVADYLDQKTNEIDSIIAKKKKQLDVLAEYKKSLIYEYVTGKKKVPANA